MSFFYLSPVKGDMPGHLLETIVIKRLEYLKSMSREDSAVYNEYVIEGSIYDNVGHFMLCVVTILAENTGFKQFFLKAEMDLFKRRLNCLSAYDIRLFAKKLLRNIKKYKDTPSFIDPLQILSQHLMLKDLAQHISSPTHTLNCTVHNIKLNFRHCLTFIAKRQVELSYGMASLPCGKWKQYLVHLFNTNLKFRVSRTNLAPLRSDPRITDILMKLKKEMFLFTSQSNFTNLLSKDVDSTSRYFPPCMLNLHKNLRAKHRLSHTQRFYYSLFLKDIGMPIEEAIDFWQMEYRQSPNGSHSCCHHWEKDEKKYLYGIRHMYGLEGCRKSYTSVNCQCIQNSDTSYSEGGCPFKSFDNFKMVQLLKSSPKYTDDLLLQINELKKRHQYTSACVLYLQKCSETHCDNNNVSFNFTPVKYYAMATKNDSLH